MKSINYLSERERKEYYYLKEQISHAASIKEVEELEKKLDLLLEKAVARYKTPVITKSAINAIKNVIKALISSERDFIDEELSRITGYPVLEITELRKEFYYDEIKRLQQLVLDGRYLNKQQELEEEVTKLERKRVELKKEDREEILKEMIENNLSEGKKEFIRQARDVVIHDAVKGYKKHITKKMLEKGISDEVILEIMDLTQSELGLLKREMTL